MVPSSRTSRHLGDHFLLGPYLVAASMASPPRRGGDKPGAVALTLAQRAVTPAAAPAMGQARPTTDPAASPAARPGFRPGAVPAHEPVRAADLLQALARGLGLSADQLAGRDPLEMAERAGALARPAPPD